MTQTNHVNAISVLMIALAMGAVVLIASVCEPCRNEARVFVRELARALR